MTARKGPKQPKFSVVELDLLVDRLSEADRIAVIALGRTRHWFTTAEAAYIMGPLLPGSKDVTQRARHLLRRLYTMGLAARDEGRKFHRHWVWLSVAHAVARRTYKGVPPWLRTARQRARDMQAELHHGSHSIVLSDDAGTVRGGSARNRGGLTPDAAGSD